MKQEMDLYEASGKLLKGLKTGALLMTRKEDQVNAMTIGWACLGIEWGKPMLVVYVRDSRFSKELLEANPNFTVCFPEGEECKSILKVCGRQSGRDVDKIRELGLTLEEPAANGVPGVKELPLTVECRVVFRKRQEPETMDPQLLRSWYSGAAEGNFHTAYYGEIVSMYNIV